MNLSSWNFEDVRSVVEHTTLHGRKLKERQTSIFCCEITTETFLMRQSGKHESNWSKGQQRVYKRGKESEYCTRRGRIREIWINRAFYYILPCL